MEFDYVVVGGGSAGCVLAARLSEDSRTSVALIEAGPSNEGVASIDVPALGGGLLQSRFDWDYSSTPEPGCGNRRIYLPRGKVLGGCSSINGMIYTRGAPADFDWSTLWTFETMLPYFLKAEDYEHGPSPFHGQGGPLSVSDGRASSPESAAFLAAAAEAGFPANQDFNGPSQLGFGAYQLTQQDGRRADVARSYLVPRENLTVLTDTTVQRIRFQSGRAVSIRVCSPDGATQVHVGKELILAAGAYGSPHLLQLSGVGDPQVLGSLGVPTVVDLPAVGRNLSDHPQVWISFAHDGPTPDMKHAQREFDSDGRGPLTSNGPEVGGFVGLDTDSPDPDLQFHAIPGLFLDGGLTPQSPSGGITIGSCVLKPRSRGRVVPVTSDPTRKPAISMDFYTHPADLRAAISGVKTSMEIAAQAALATYTTRPIALPAGWSTGDLEAFTRTHTQTLFHPTGTCAHGTVVGDDLRVNGLDNVRVVDASVFPEPIRGNTNAPTIALAERAAAMVQPASDD